VLVSDGVTVTESVARTVPELLAVCEYVGLGVSVLDAVYVGLLVDV
jgi:hypothetical protein